jgi:hypothetical protein
VHSATRQTIAEPIVREVVDSIPWYYVIVPARHLTLELKKDPAMAQATVKNQERIIANEKRIIRGQERLATIVRNQEKIIRNQQAIIKNQKKILSNQSKLLAR